MKDYLEKIVKIYGELKLDGLESAERKSKLDAQEKRVEEAKLKLDARAKDLSAKERIIKKYEDFEQYKDMVKKQNTENQLMIVKLKEKEVVIDNAAKAVMASKELIEKEKATVNSKIAELKKRELAVSKKEEALKKSVLNKIDKELGGK